MMRLAGIIILLSFFAAIVFRIMGILLSDTYLSFEKVKSKKSARSLECLECLKCLGCLKLYSNLCENGTTNSKNSWRFKF